MRPDLQQAEDDLIDAAEGISREENISFDAAIRKLEARRDPAWVVYEEAIPNTEARKAAFIARQVRGGSTRAEALDLWEQEERRLSEAEASGSRGAMRLSARHADHDIAYRVVD